MNLKFEIWREGGFRVSLNFETFPFPGEVEKKKFGPSFYGCSSWGEEGTNPTTSGFRVDTDVLSTPLAFYAK